MSKDSFSIGGVNDAMGRRDSLPLHTTLPPPKKGTHNRSMTTAVPSTLALIIADEPMSDDDTLSLKPNRSHHCRAQSCATVVLPAIKLPNSSAVNNRGAFTNGVFTDIELSSLLNPADITPLPDDHPSNQDSAILSQINEMNSTANRHSNGKRRKKRKKNKKMGIIGGDDDGNDGDNDYDSADSDSHNSENKADNDSIIDGGNDTLQLTVDDKTIDTDNDGVNDGTDIDSANVIAKKLSRLPNGGAKTVRFAENEITDFPEVKFTEIRMPHVEQDTARFSISFSRTEKLDSDFEETVHLSDFAQEFQTELAKDKYKKARKKLKNRLMTPIVSDFEYSQTQTMVGSPTGYTSLDEMGSMTRKLLDDRGSDSDSASNCSSPYHDPPPPPAYDISAPPSRQTSRAPSSAPSSPLHFSPQHVSPPLASAPAPPIEMSLPH